MADKNAGATYVMESKATSEKLGDHNGEITDVSSLKSRFDNFHAATNSMAAYFNLRGGWVDAQPAVRVLAHKNSQGGISFITGPRAKALFRIRSRYKQVFGVNVAEGQPLLATQTIIATGACTRVFVCLPYPGSNLLKVVHHGFGVANQVAVDNGSRLVSSPKLAGNNAEAGYLPEDADRHLRDGLKQLVPQFGDRPWWRRRMCWYSDTSDGDLSRIFIPICKGFSLQRAARASRYIVDFFEHKASDELRKKWRLRAPDGKEAIPKQGDGSRGGQPWRLLLPHEQAKL